MTTKSDKLSDSPSTQLFVYGLDEVGKPKGARFPASDTEKVLPVATAMNLQCSQAYSEEVANLGMKLPVGRIYARGKAFIPNIKRDLYDKLLAAIGSCKEEHDHRRSKALLLPLLPLLPRAAAWLMHQPKPELSCHRWLRDCRRTGNRLRRGT